nr:AAA family ATPase [Amycolatopsis sp. YIM 10]
MRSATVDLGALNVLVGANGAGKSNFVHAFELLGRIAERRLGLFVGLSGGAAALLHHGAERIRMRVPIISPGCSLRPTMNSSSASSRSRARFRPNSHTRVAIASRTCTTSRSSNCSATAGCSTSRTRAATHRSSSEYRRPTTFPCATMPGTWRRYC